MARNWPEFVRPNEAETRGQVVKGVALPLPSLQSPCVLLSAYLSSYKSLCVPSPPLTAAFYSFFCLLLLSLLLSCVLLPVSPLTATLMHVSLRL